MFVGGGGEGEGGERVSQCDHDLVLECFCEGNLCSFYSMAV